MLQAYISHYFWSSNSFSGLWESCTCGTVTIWYNLASSHDIITVFPPTNHWWCDQDKTTYHFQNIFTVEVSEIRSLGYQIQGTYVSLIPCEYSVYRSFPTFGFVTRSFLVASFSLYQILNVSFQISYLYDHNFPSLNIRFLFFWKFSISWYGAEFQKSQGGKMCCYYSERDLFFWL